MYSTQWLLEGDSLHLLRPRKINLIIQLLWYLILVRSLNYTRNSQDKKKKEKNGEYTCRSQAETSLVREKKQVNQNTLHSKDLGLNAKYKLLAFE